MNKDIKQLTKDYLKQQKLMQLATVSEGNPWICSVWQASDEDLNIYFFSAVARRHSLEIDNDNRVAGALALPHTPSDDPRGLQFEGTVVKLENEEEIAIARSLYEIRIFDTETIDSFMAHKERPHAFYKITPSKFVLFDVVNFPDDPRQELSI